MFLKGRQSLPGLPNYLRFVVVFDILGSRKFWKYLERVAIQKSLRTIGLEVSLGKSTLGHICYLDKVVVPPISTTIKRLKNAYQF